MKTIDNEKEMIPCPVCGKMFNKGGMIFHFRKTSVFEVYNWYLKTKTDWKSGYQTFPVISPHQEYMDKNTTVESKFKI